MCQPIAAGCAARFLTAPALMSAAFARLRSLLISHPYASNAALAGAMMLVGDRLAQRAEARARARAA